MSDLYESFSQVSKSLLPLFAFLIGAVGSIHCVGMCGGLSLAINRTQNEFWLYNVGRLCGYLVLGLLFAVFGSFFTDPLIKEVVSFAGGIFIAAFLIVNGLVSIKGRELSLSVPIFRKLYDSLFKNFYHAKFGRSFGIGAGSILLPCAISNGFILAALSLTQSYEALILIVFFWAGTLPAMIFGVSFIRKQTTKFGVNGQKVMAVLYLVLGLGTLIYKVMMAIESELIC